MDLYAAAQMSPSIFIGRRAPTSAIQSAQARATARGFVGVFILGVRIGPFMFLILTLEENNADRWFHLQISIFSNSYNHIK